MSPKLHLKVFSPALLGNVYRALVVRRVELTRRQDTAGLENVQTVFLHVATRQKLLEEQRGP